MNSNDEAKGTAARVQNDFKAPKGWTARFKVLSPQRVRIILTKTNVDPFEGMGDFIPSIPSTGTP